MGDKPGPDRIVTIEDMVKEIYRSDKPVMTVGDIAEWFDVSGETIRRRQDELESHPDVCVEKVGSARAYWVPDRHSPSEDTVEVSKSEPNDLPDFPTMVREDPQVALSLAEKGEQEMQDYLLRTIKEERPDWYEENVGEATSI